MPEEKEIPKAPHGGSWIVDLETGELKLVQPPTDFIPPKEEEKE